MDFDQLKGFYFAAKFKSFTEAAAKLYLTQPAISLQVKALEKELEERLFDRVGRSVRLTQAGEILYRQAEDLFDRLHEIQQVMSGLKTLERGRLCLGASDTTSLYYLPELLRSFRAAYPKVDLVVESIFSESASRKVLDRDLDIGIVTLHRAEPRLTTVPLFSQRLVGIVASGHPLARRRGVTLGDFAREPLIFLCKGSLTRKLIEGYMLRQKLPLEVAMEFSNFEIIKRYVAAGHGVSLVPEAAVSDAADTLHTIRFRRHLSIDVGAVYRDDRTLSHPARVFLEMVGEHFATRGAAPRHQPSAGSGRN